MIVMAFRCLTVWLMEHDYLMQDKECLHIVLQVVELGVSGSMSQVSSILLSITIQSLFSTRLRDIKCCIDLESTAFFVRLFCGLSCFLLDSNRFMIQLSIIFLLSRLFVVLYIRCLSRKG